MSQYLLLLRDEPEEISPSELQQVIEQIGAWYQEVSRKTRIIQSAKLKDGEGRTLRMDQGQVLVDGPYSETKEAVGGFFLIEAGDYDEAVAISRNCPILSFGGSIEIRELDPLGETQRT